MEAAVKYYLKIPSSLHAARALCAYLKYREKAADEWRQMITCAAILSKSVQSSNKERTRA